MAAVNTNARTSNVPYRQIRAFYDESTITVYQAYSKEIASAAVREQKLDASPLFSPGRMTWIKPSWCWMMYRSGYSTKDPRQERILALKMKKEHFRELLTHAVVCGNGSLTAEERLKNVRVQWDPERSPRIGMLPYRSIQIGISGKIRDRWVEEWIYEIQDVTAMALGLMEALRGNDDVTKENLEKMGLLPKEIPYEVDEELRTILKMDVVGE